MKSKAEKEIYCEVKSIHKPKPKKNFKINDCFKGHSRCAHGPKKIPNYNNDFYRKKANEYNNKNKINKMDFDSISMEEIENDFLEFKAKEEELKAENELFKLLNNPLKDEKNYNNKRKLKQNSCPEDVKNNINKKDK